jgi:hypothetical protein
MVVFAFRIRIVMAAAERREKRVMKGGAHSSTESYR